MRFDRLPWAYDADFRGALDRRLLSCDRLLAIADRFEGMGPGGSGSKSGMAELTKATKTFRAVVSLGSLGMGQPALALAGSVYESAIVIMWAQRNVERADHLAQLHAHYWFELDRRQQARSAGTPEASGLPLMSQEEETEARAVFGETASGLWTGHVSLGDVVAEVVEAEPDTYGAHWIRYLFEVPYKHAEALWRATGLGTLSLSEGIDDDTKTVSMVHGPSTEQVANALFLGSAAYLLGIESTVELEFPQLDDDVTEAYGLLWRAGKDPAELIGLADDDPCPCDRPDTLWSQCHKWTASLGTTVHSRFESDGLAPVPGSPGDKEGNLSDKAGDTAALDQSDGHYGIEPTGPSIFTFACRLPFAIGLTDDGSLRSYIRGTRYLDPNDIAHFGDTPYVRIRLCNVTIDGFNIFPKETDRALTLLYGEAGGDKITGARWGQGLDTYEQWISLETPAALTDADNKDDQAYTFHRCMAALELFLRAHEVVFTDMTVYPISTQDLSPIMWRGAYIDDKWVNIGPMLMHPEAFPYSFEPRSSQDHFNNLRSAMELLEHRCPFLTTRHWKLRAQRSERYRGDRVDCIISLQIAAEAMVYDLWRMLLVDKGRSASEIAGAMGGDPPFKSVLIKKMPMLLGGSWDLTRANTPLGGYWRELYELRNRIAHTGYQPSTQETEIAMAVFTGLDEHLSSLVWKRHSSYPRTLLAKVGPKRLAERGWMTANLRLVMDRIQGEQLPWYWPADVAGRTG